jgi:hypothetical protein
MSASEPLPRSLRLVALVFLLTGISSLISLVVGALNHRVNLDFGVIGGFVCFGLLRLSSGWRTCALVLTYVGIVMSPVVAILSIGAPQHVVYLNLFGIYAAFPSLFVLLACIFGFGLALWQWSVLKRPDIRVLFFRKEINSIANLDVTKRV